MFLTEWGCSCKTAGSDLEETKVTNFGTWRDAVDREKINKTVLIIIA